MQERLLAPVAADAKWLIHLDLKRRDEDEDELLNALEPETLRRDVTQHLGFGLLDMSDTASMTQLVDALRGNTHVHASRVGRRQVPIANRNTTAVANSLLQSYCSCACLASTLEVFVGRVMRASIRFGSRRSRLAPSVLGEEIRHTDFAQANGC